MADELAECKKQYELDLAAQTHCCLATTITAENKEANRSMFNKLFAYQEDINKNGSLPYSGYDEHDSKKDKKSGSEKKAEKITYPEGLTVPNPRLLKKILPIPDVHKVSDCDTIYRFLIGRKFDEVLAMQDLIHYIAFREKYNLDHILWDHEVEAMINGLDGEELLRATIDLIAKRAKDKHANTSDPTDLREKVNLKKIKIPRPLLQPGWAAWNCGVDKTGHVLFYQRPNPSELAKLEKRWRYVENEYDCRNPDFHSVTPPYSNLLVRLYLRHAEKGRRLSRLLNYNQQQILREGLKINLSADSSNGSDAAQNTDATHGFHDNGGGIDCLVDVGSVKVSHLTGSKCRDAIKTFRVLGIMGQFFYPENMKRMIIVNGGFVFNMLFKIVKPWLDPVTQKKITLLSATNKSAIDSTTSPAASDAPAGESKNTGDNATSESDDDEGVNNSANFALRNALAEFIEDRFIPSWYGGHLPVHDAPLFYGQGVPKQFSESPYFPLAQEKLEAKVLPELLTDAFIFANSAEDKPVSQKEFDAFCEDQKKLLFR